MTPAFVAPAAGASATALEPPPSSTACASSPCSRLRATRATVTMTRTRLEGWVVDATVGLTRSVEGKPAAFSPGGAAPATRVTEFDVEGLLVGRELLAITVTAEDSRYSKTTLLELTRYRPGGEASLRDLVVYGEPGSRVPAMLPAFYSETLEYDATLDFDTEAVRLVPVAEDAAHRAVRVNTVFQRSGESSRTYPVAPGGQVKLTVSVIAQDGETRRLYVVRVFRELPRAERAAGLAVMPAGARALVRVRPGRARVQPVRALEHTVASVRVAPIANDTEYDRVLVNGARQPSGALSREISVPAGYGNGDQTTRGETTVTVVVFAQDGITRRTYAVFIARDPAPIFPDDATLRELRVSPRRRRLAPRSRRPRAYRLFVPARVRSRA